MKKLIVTPSGTGELLHIAGGTYRIVISSRQTNGSYAVIEMVVPPLAGPVPHVHPQFSETFLIQEGEVCFMTELGDVTAVKGDVVSIPDDHIVHHFKNNSDKPAIMLCTVIPGGLDLFFEDLNELFIQENALNKPPSDDLKSKIMELSAKHDQHLLPPDYLSNN